jgi:hypothetical protein
MPASSSTSGHHHVARGRGRARASRLLRSLEPRSSASEPGKERRAHAGGRNVSTAELTRAPRVRRSWQPGTRRSRQGQAAAAREQVRASVGGSTSELVVQHAVRHELRTPAIPQDQRGLQCHEDRRTRGKLRASAAMAIHMVLLLCARVPVSRRLRPRRSRRGPCPTAGMPRRCRYSAATAPGEPRTRQGSRAAELSRAARVRRSSSPAAARARQSSTGRLACGGARTAQLARGGAAHPQRSGRAAARAWRSSPAAPCATMAN